MTLQVLKAQPTNPQLTNPLAGEMAAVLETYHTESGRTLLGLVDESPVLLIFLRHFGCSFCRQTLDDVSRIREQIEGRGVRPVFVHLGTPERAKPYFDYYHFRISSGSAIPRRLSMPARCFRYGGRVCLPSF